MNNLLKLSFFALILTIGSCTEGSVLDNTYRKGTYRQDLDKLSEVLSEEEYLTLYNYIEQKKDEAGNSDLLGRKYSAILYEAELFQKNAPENEIDVNK